MVLAVRRGRDRYGQYSWWPSRTLTPTLHVKDVRGTCKWCGLPADTPRRMWHNECVVAYKVATGQHSIWWSCCSPNDPKAPGSCAACGGRGVWEIDHIVALGIAQRRYHLGLDRRWWRAWWVENLQWLCSECHRAKTRRDRQVMRDLDNGVVRMEFAA